MYLVHKAVPSETEDRVVGFPGTSTSARVASYGDFAPAPHTKEEVSKSCLHSSNSVLQRDEGKRFAMRTDLVKVAVGSVTNMHLRCMYAGELGSADAL